MFSNHPSSALRGSCSPGRQPAAPRAAHGVRNLVCRGRRRQNPAEMAALGTMGRGSQQLIWRHTFGHLPQKTHLWGESILGECAALLSGVENSGGIRPGGDFYAISGVMMGTGHT